VNREGNIISAWLSQEKVRVLSIDIGRAIISAAEVDGASFRRRGSVVSVVEFLKHSNLAVKS